ncbi:MAG: UDP-N-acetylmuramoyl-tripeptide--D-alanyl-D-alanine ligase [Phycisphaerae bacterium]|nr:UDP-N-acetylmuramoyl-tripeptide--D-alanyl-D-alanine ligase [Phycisphaerae bacterium]
MKRTSLEDIRKIVDGQSFWWPGADCAGADVNVASAAVRSLAAVSVEAVEMDSRKIGPDGPLFIAIKGETFDAHDFLPQAFAAGAGGALVDVRVPLPADLARRFGDRLIGVSDTLAALGRLGRWHRDAMPARVIAVTGSNGKTTTKRMLHHILSRVAGGTPASRLHGTCSPKSFNNNIGVPLTLLGVGECDQYVVCEVGTNAPGEITQLGEICRPDVAVITSVGETHLEKLGSLELVAKEKASLLRSLSYAGLRGAGQAVVWADNESLRREAVAATGGAAVTWFGQSADAHWRLVDFEGGADCVRFSVRVGGRDVRVVLPQPGRHSASNATAAMAAAACLGVSAEDAAAALADFGGVEMRLEAVPAGSVRLINDAYNANPASMAAAADVLGDQPGARRVMIAGDMRELGESTISLHERTGREIASGRVDFLIGIGLLGRYIARGAASAGATARTAEFDSVESAIEALPALLRAGDTILIKGSRGMAMERLVGPIVRFGAAAT